MTTDVETRERFWAERWRWPPDTLTHIFLARVVEDFGKALLGDRWQGDEPATAFIKELPGNLWLGLSPEELERAAGILVRHHEGYRSRNPGGYAFRMPTEEEWPFAVEWSRQESQKSLEALSRYWDTCGALYDAFRLHGVATATIAFGGGVEVPQPRAFWNCTFPQGRFDFCRVDPEHPFGPLRSLYGHWIYVEKKSFMAFMVRLHGNRALAASEGSAHVSPFIQCMLDTSQALGVTPANQPKKENVILEL